MPRVIAPHLSLPEQLYQLGRPANFVLPFVLTVMGYVLGGGSVTTPHTSLYILAIALLLIHTATTLFNDLADRSIDQTNDASTPIISGSPVDIRRFIWIGIGCLFVALCLLALTPLAVQLTLWSLIVLGMLYNFRPMQLSRRPISSIVTLGFSYAGLPLLAGYLLNQQSLTAPVLLLAACWAVGRMSLSVLKDFKDKKGDALHHKRTFLLQFGTMPTLLASLVAGVISMVGIGIYLIDYIQPELRLFFGAYVCALIALIIWQRVQLLRHPQQANSLFHQYLLWQIAIDGSLLVWVTLF